MRPRRFAAAQSRASADGGALAEPERDGASAISDRDGRDGARHRAGAGLKADRSEFMALGLNLADALRLVRSGSYDVVSTQVGLASRDDPFLEGIDLIGVSTNMDDLQAAVDAYREIFDKRIGERFGAKVLAIWPFGPQVFFCNQPIKTLDDLKTLRVRSFTPSMSKLIEALGATPVSIPFPEVYPSLQRGVANCGVTSPTSANTGKWPEVTSHLLPLSVSGSIQAHLVNAAWLAKLTPPQQEAMTRELRQMEKDLWALARTINEDATNCSIGKEPCAPKPHGKYTMTLADGRAGRPRARAQDLAGAGPHRMGDALRARLSELQAGLERLDRQGAQPDHSVSRASPDV